MTEPELPKEPFVRYQLDEDIIEGEGVISVRLNQEETAWLQEIKEDLNIGSSSKALKTAAFIGKNVIQATFTRRLLKYLFKNQRAKLD